jgi:PST family polysaccharide transporter
VSTKFSQLYRSIAYLFLVQVSNVFIPILVIPFFSHNLNVEMFGLYMLCISITNIFQVTLDLSITLFSIKKVADIKKNRKSLGEYVSHVLAFKMIVLLTFALIAVISFLAVEPNVNTKVFVIVYFILIFQSLQPLWLFQSLEKMEYIAWSVVPSRLFYLGCVLNLNFKTEDPSLPLILWFLSQAMVCTIGIGLLIKQDLLLNIKLKLKNIFKLAIEIKSYVASRLAVVAYSSGNTIAVSIIGGVQGVAFYTVTEQLYKLAQSSLSPLMQVFFPYIYRTKNLKLYLKITTLLIMISLLVLGGILFNASELLVRIYGVDYIEATPLLKLMAIIVGINITSTLFGYPIFAYFDMIKFCNYTIFVGVVFHIFLLALLFLSNSLSTVNILYVSMFTEFVVMFIRLILFFRAGVLSNGK